MGFARLASQPCLHQLFDREQCHLPAGHVPRSVRCTVMTGTRLATSWVPAVNVEERADGKRPDILLMHYTGMESAQAARDWLICEESRVSCHYLVDEVGAITQMVNEDKKARHAGVSFWKGDRDINSCSIGIEIQNRGHGQNYAEFPPRQMDAVIALSLDIVDRHAIPAERVLAHSDVAPERKQDPGEKFDWQVLHMAGVGHWVKPAPTADGDVLQYGDESAAVQSVQSLLLDYGYNVTVNGRFDEQTLVVLQAFQRHFRPDRVDGIADTSTVDTLKALIDALAHPPTI